MKIRIQKETNVIKDTIVYHIEKWNGSYWKTLYSTQSGVEVLSKFERLKELSSEVTIETIQEFEKKD